MSLSGTRFASSGVIGTISKLTKSCILRLTPQHLFFVLSGKVTNGGVSMWCELSQVGSRSSDRSIDRSIDISILELRLALGSLPALLLLPQANVFDEYQMEGFSSEDNEICLEVVPENLSRALKTAQNAKAVKVKLTRKHCPCLTITAELVSVETSEGRRSITGDVTGVCGAGAEERSGFWRKGTFGST